MSKNETRTRQISRPIRKTISKILYHYSKNSKLKKKLNKTKLLFKQDLIKQFIKFIFEDGKYFSRSYDKIEKIF